MAGVELTPSPERAYFFLLRARELEAKAPRTDPASDYLEEGLSRLGYNPADIADRH